MESIYYLVGHIYKKNLISCVAPLSARQSNTKNFQRFFWTIWSVSRCLQNSYDLCKFKMWWIIYYATKETNYDWVLILSVLKLLLLRAVFCFRHGNKNDSPGPGPGQYNVTGLSAKGKSYLRVECFCKIHYS